MRSRRVLGGVVLVLVVVAAGGAWLAARGDGGGGDGADAATLAAAGDASGGPGTPLGDGLEVAPGSSLLGPVVVSSVDGSGAATEWTAVVLVEGDPLEVWRAYVAQMAERFPGDRIDPAATPGCDPGVVPEEVCRAVADEVDAAGARALELVMGSAPGDVTGRYVLRLHASTATGSLVTDTHQGGGAPWSGGALPPPADARPRPAVGGPLAPETVAYEGDEDRYVLVDGSQLVAQYGAGSITGGFQVLLRVTPGADVGAVGAAYAQQADQYEGEPIGTPEVVVHDGTTFTRYEPPGGAGGYSGVVTAVDRPGGDDDYVTFELLND